MTILTTLFDLNMVQWIRIFTLSFVAANIAQGWPPFGTHLRINFCFWFFGTLSLMYASVAVAVIICVRKLWSICPLLRIYLKYLLCTITKWALLSATWHWWALQSIAEYYWALPSFAEDHWSLLSTVKELWTLLSIDEFYWARVLCSMTGHCWRFLSITEYC